MLREDVLYLWRWVNDWLYGTASYRSPIQIVRPWGSESKPGQGGLPKCNRCVLRGCVESVRERLC